MKSTLILVVLVSLATAGCSNVGDTNPVSPEAMAEMRKSQDTGRANFKPEAGRPPSGN